MRDLSRQTLRRGAAALALSLALSGCAESVFITTQGPVVEAAALPGGLNAAEIGASVDDPEPVDPAAQDAPDETYAVPSPAELTAEDLTLSVSPGFGEGESSAAQAVAIWSGLQQLRQTLRDHPVRLAVPNILQNPELPNGCEITSAAIVLNYLGAPADKVVLARDYLRKGENHLTADPETEYMGTPFADGVGYYCMPAPVAAAVNAYLADTGIAGLRAQDISGADTGALEEYLRKGTPVLVWITQRFEAPRYAGHFKLPDGSRPYTNLHCVVLTGCDEEKYYITDPLAQTSSVDKETFSQIYAEMGRRALVIAPQ